MADNRPPKPRPYAPGETYIDMVTGQFKQVQVSGPDLVIPVASSRPESMGAAQPVSAERTGGVYGEYDAAKAELDSITELLARADAARAQFGARGIGQAPSTVVIFNNREYDLAGLDKEIARLKKTEARAKKRFSDAEKFVKPLQKKVDDIKAEIDGAGDDLQRKQAAQAKLPAAEAELADAKSVPAGTKLSKETVVTTTGQRPGGAGRGGRTTQPTTTRPKTGSAAELRAIEESQRDVPIGTVPGAAPTAGGGRPKNPTRGQEWTGPKGATWRWDGTKWNRVTKPTTGGTGTDTVEDGQPTEDVLAGLDLENLKKKYPGYSWVWDLAPKFNDTKKLWADFLNNDITAERFNNLIGQSSWYTDQKNISETRRIKNRYGDILDPANLAKLVNESIQFAYEDDELDTAFFSTTLARNVLTGEYIDSRAAQIALSSNLANTYRNYAKSMFMTADDKEIEDLLTGKTTEEDFYRNKRDLAKSVYGNWATLLDNPNMTMETIVKPWRNMAAEVLEMDPSQIDMSKPQFQAAYAGSADGKMGAMSLGDWYIKLRTDATYGWDKTTQAKQEAQQLGYNIAKTFGKA